ncbi:MAG: DUF1697 domain-containing protein [Bryobacteraceae bacterium]
MTAVIALLRAVNVGGTGKLKMEELRALCEAIKLQNPRTYVQSGNIVFGTKEKNLVRLATRIEDAIEERFTFRPPVILRTADELRDIVQRNPFAGRDGIEPGKLIAIFLPSDPGEDARQMARGIKADPEEVHLSGRELYIYFPVGQGKSKLQMPPFDRALKMKGTGRNWNSVMNLLEMAEDLEA